MTTSFSFCISTYKRKQLISEQVARLLTQTYKNFEIIICDNDPESDLQKSLSSFDDVRIKYYNNGKNLGVIESFNRAIDLATTDYVIPVTDDDPIVDFFLSEMTSLIEKYPNHSIYAGFLRHLTPQNTVEVISANDFFSEILDWNKTENILWSSCCMNRLDVLATGKIPDYGSPHLSDHAMIAFVGSKKGGVIINKMYSTYSQHQGNFSKSNLSQYYIGCKGFYEILTGNFKDKKSISIVVQHLRYWFLVSFFTIKRYYSATQKNLTVLREVDAEAWKILELPFMKKLYFKYKIKSAILKVKVSLKIVK